MDKSLLKTKKKIDFDFEITQAKEQIKNLYIKYMAEVTENMIDDVANSLISIIAELEALKLRMHSSYDEDRLRRNEFEKMFNTVLDSDDTDKTVNNADYLK